MSATADLPHPFDFCATGVSPEAEILALSACEVTQFEQQSISLYGEKSALISELLDLADECDEKDWDSYGALPLDELAIDNAIAFIHTLPPEISMPELAPDPDGEVSLDWIASKTSLFSVSCGSSHRLAYSWLDGTDRGHAVAAFDGREIPKRILDGIHEITFG